MTSMRFQLTKLIAINKKTNTAVVSRGGVFVFIDTEQKDVIKTEVTCVLSAADGWESSSSEPTQVWAELAQAATTNLSIESTEYADESRVFRVPRNVQKASRTFTDETTTLKDIHAFATGRKIETKLVREWVAKVTDQFPVPPQALLASAFTPSDTSVYFGRATGDDTTECDAMYALNSEGQWAQRIDGEWQPVTDEDPGDSYNLIMLDPETAQTLAKWADEPDELDGGSLELALINPQETGLFYAAEAELDFEFLDRMFDVYDSQERSINASKQVRQAGGKFGGSPGGAKATAETPKARLTVKLPLIPNISARIDQYLADVAKQRGGNDTPAASDKFASESLTAALQPLMAEGSIEISEELFADAIEKGIAVEVGVRDDGVLLYDLNPEFAVTAEQSGAPVTDIHPLYIAIVDNLDNDAVLDLVSLVPPAKGVQGDVTAWKRAAGQWVAANDILAQLRGSTPPSCVELSDPAVLKQVIDQVDKSTKEEGTETPAAPGETEVAPDGTAPASQPATPQTAPIPVKTSNFGDMAARGYAFSDGSLLILDANDLRTAVKEASTIDQQLHVIKRARALNRIDMIPDSWNPSEANIKQGLWGPYGEILPVSAAGGLDRNRGGAEKLRHYWTVGPGGAKIAWRTPGDWTRCVSHLSKYLGDRSKGYCALRHKEMNGYYPGDHRNK